MRQEIKGMEEKSRKETEALVQALRRVEERVKESGADAQPIYVEALRKLRLSTHTPPDNPSSPLTNDFTENIPPTTVSGMNNRGDPNNDDDYWTYFRKVCRLLADDSSANRFHGKDYH